LKRNLISYNKFIKLQSFIVVFVDVSATAAAFVGTTVRQVWLRQTDEPRRGVLPTSTHLWLLTVRRSHTWSDEGSSGCRNVNKNNNKRL